MKIHEIFSEGSSLIEATEFNHSSHNDLILGYTEDTLILQSLNGIDDTKGHADRQCRRHSDGDEIKELLNQINNLYVLVDEND